MELSGKNGYIRANGDRAQRAYKFCTAKICRSPDAALSSAATNSTAGSPFPFIEFIHSVLFRVGYDK